MALNEKRFMTACTFYGPFTPSGGSSIPRVWSTFKPREQMGSWGEGLGVGDARSVEGRGVAGGERREGSEC